MAEASEPKEICDYRQTEGGEESQTREEKDGGVVDGSADGSPQSGVSSAARTNPRQYSKKRKSDELMPKRPVPPFVLFSQEHRKILKEAEPTLQLKDSSRLLSQMWNAMSDEEKQPYIHQCEAAKLRYAEELRQLGMQRKRPRTTTSLSQLATPTEEKRRGRKRKQPEPVVLPEVMPKREKGVGGLSAPAVPSSSASSSRSSLPAVFVPGTDIPVFSEQFLHYNKELEGHVTQFRRGNNTLQEEVTLLEQGLAEKTSVIEGLREQVTRQRQQNTALRSRLQEVRSIVASSFSSLPLPPNHEPCCAGNVEEYLHHLGALMKGEEASELRSKVATITTRLRDDIRMTSV